MLNTRKSFAKLFTIIISQKKTLTKTVTRLVKWLILRLWTKRLWVWVPLQSTLSYWPPSWYLSNNVYHTWKKLKKYSCFTSHLSPIQFSFIPQILYITFILISTLLFRVTKSSSSLFQPFFNVTKDTLNDFWHCESMKNFFKWNTSFIGDFCKEPFMQCTSAQFSTISEIIFLR